MKSFIHSILIIASIFSIAPLHGMGIGEALSRSIERTMNRINRIRGERSSASPSRVPSSSPLASTSPAAFPGAGGDVMPEPYGAPVSTEELKLLEEVKSKMGEKEVLDKDLLARIKSAHSSYVYSVLLDHTQWGLEPELLRHADDRERYARKLPKIKSLLDLTRDGDLPCEKERLEAAYSIFIERSNMFCSKVLAISQKDPVFAAMLNTFPVYAQINAGAAQKQLEAIVEKNINDEISLTNMHSTGDQYKLLGMLKQLNSARFEEYAQSECTQSLHMFLRTIIDHPEMSEPLKGTILAPEQLIEQTLNRAAEKDERGEWALGVLLRDGQKYHEQYKDRIVSVLQKKEGKKFSDFVRDLSGSPSEKLRGLERARQQEQSEAALEEKLYRLRIEGDNAAQRRLIDELLSVSVEKQAELDGLIYEALKGHETPSDYGIQKLLYRAQERKDECFSEMLCDYFKLSPKKRSVSTVSEAFECALESGDLPIFRMAHIMSVAKETGLSLVMRPELLKKYKCNVIKADEISLKERSQALNDLLKDGLIDDIEREVATVEGTVFGRYATAALHAHGSPLFSKDYFAARRELQELSKEHEGLISDPDNLKELYNPFIDPQSRCAGSISYPFFSGRHDPIHQLVYETFQNPSFSGQCIVGYALNDYAFSRDFSKGRNYRLYVCDKKTGHPMWALPFTSKKPHPYTIVNRGGAAGKNYLYCVTDDGFVQYDLESGEERYRFTSPVEGEKRKEFPYRDELIIDEHISITKNGIVYFINKGKLAIWDGSSDGVTLVKLSARAGEGVVVGENLVYNADGSKLFLINKEGEISEIADDYEGKLTEVNGTLIYRQEDKNLVCIDPISKEQQWKISLDAPLQGSPQLSSDGSKLFVLTYKSLSAFEVIDKSLSAFSVSADSIKPLWKESIEKDRSVEINQFALSEDGAVIYGIHNGVHRTDSKGVKLLGRPVYKFDTEHGIKQLLYEIEIGYWLELCGIDSGKIFLRCKSQNC